MTIEIIIGQYPSRLVADEVGADVGKDVVKGAFGEGDGKFAGVTLGHEAVATPKVLPSCEVSCTSA